MATIATRLASHITRVGYGDLDATICEQTKKLVLDLLGVALAGFQLMEFPRQMVAHLTTVAGCAQASLIAGGTKIPAANAAMANAVCAHALDMDDGHRFGGLHPGTAVIPAALAAAELTGCSGREFIAAVVAGYEIMIRVGRAVSPDAIKRGFHLTGIAGTFGAAAAAGKISGLSPDTLAGALGMAGLQSAGLLQVNHDAEGAKLKPLNPGRAAGAGVMAVQLAQAGARGPKRIFEGRHGFLKAFTETADPESLTRDLDRTPAISGAYVKLYAACRHCHAPMEAAREALAQSGRPLADIERIKVETYPLAIEIAGNGAPGSPSAARFSIAYCVAQLLIKRRADPEIQALAAKVRVTSGHKWAGRYPDQRGATATLLVKDGRSWSAQVRFPSGEPENPASWATLEHKFFTNATTLIPAAKAKQLATVVMDLENRSIADLVQHFS